VEDDNDMLIVPELKEGTRCYLPHDVEEDLMRLMKEHNLPIELLPKLMGWGHHASLSKYTFKSLLYQKVLSSMLHWYSQDSCGHPNPVQVDTPGNFLLTTVHHLKFLQQGARMLKDPERMEGALFQYNGSTG